jgi:putative endonuclease
MARHNEIGQKGEEIVEKYLVNKGFSILDRNYRKKWGELDIVAEKNGKVHIIEVKTVSRKSWNGEFEQEINYYRPEDNMHFQKIQRLKRAIQTYLLSKFRKSEPEWQFDLVCVFLDMEKRVAKVKVLENVIL